MSSITNKQVKQIIRDSLGIEKEKLEEAYSSETKHFDLPTELLGVKNKKAHRELYENYVKNFNRISAELDTVDRDEASLNHSQYRSLKIDETYNMNAVYLHELYFSNISDVKSEVAMDTLASYAA